MCVSLEPADFSQTLIALTATNHPVTGFPIHSLLYRNTAQNHAPGGKANAMLLHFPAVDGMTKENIIDTSQFKNCADDIVRTVTPPQPQTRGASLSFGMSKSVEVFEHDIYTIALARKVEAIPEALDRVPEHKRPAVNKELFKWYGQTFPGYTFAFCCFSESEAATASPLLWWYSPMNPSLGMMPGVDCHTGGTPELDVLVETDHWAVLGSNRESYGLKRVRYSDSIPDRSRAFLPSYVAGRHYQRREKNGDFVFPISAIAEGDTSRIKRQLLPQHSEVIPSGGLRSASA